MQKWTEIYIIEGHSIDFCSIGLKPLKYRSDILCRSQDRIIDKIKSGIRVEIQILDRPFIGSHIRAEMSFFVRDSRGIKAIRFQLVEFLFRTTVRHNKNDFSIRSESLDVPLKSGADPAVRV